MPIPTTLSSLSLVLTIELIIIGSAGYPVAVGGEPREFLYLYDPANELRTTDLSDQQSLLARELVRQSVLMAARDELGIVARDESLEDSRDIHVESIQMTTWISKDDKVVYEITPYHDPASKKKHTGSLANSSQDGRPDYISIAKELVARSRSEFVNLLKQYDLKIIDRPKKSQPLADEGLTRLLARLTPLDQLEAIRTLHFKHESIGDTEEVLEGLTLGYSNMAMLTSDCWSTKPTIFAARALLYGQKLKSAFPESRRALQHVAYSLAMVGLEADALHELTLADMATDSGSSPPWVDSLRAQLRYDADFKNGGDDEISEFLAFRRLGGEWRSTQPSANVARRFLKERHAGCVPMVRSLALGESINDKHLSIPAADKLLRTDWLRVKSWPLSESAAKEIDEERPLETIPIVLGGEVETDRGDPSYASMGGLLREINMLWIHDRLKFLSQTLGVPSDEEYLRSWKAVASHPNQHLVRLGQIRINTARDFLLKSYADEISDIRYAHLRPMSVLAHTQGCAGLYSRFQDEATRYADNLCPDLLLKSKLNGTSIAKVACASWVKVSPFRPIAIFNASAPFDNGFDLDAEGMRVAHHPEATRAVVEYLLKRERIDDALRLLQDTIASQEEPWLYTTLAQIYWDKRDFDQWRSTIDEFVKQPEQDLRHFHARADVAYYLLEKGDAKEAQKYARKSAEAYSARGLYAFARCEEALGRHEQAIGIYKALVDRYPAESFSFLLAAHRLGHSKAIQVANDYLQSFRPPLQEGASLVEHEQRAVAFALLGENGHSADAWQTAFDKKRNAYDGIMCALMHEANGNLETRNKVITAVVELLDPGQSHRAEASFAELLKNSLESKIELTDSRIEDLEADLGVATKANIDFFWGAHLVMSGEQERGRNYLSRSAQAFYTGRWSSTLAAVWMKRFSKEEPIKNEK